jgi:hypothetical protein
MGRAQIGRVDAERPEVEESHWQKPHGAVAATGFRKHDEGSGRKWREVVNVGTIRDCVGTLARVVIRLQVFGKCRVPNKYDDHAA